ncbi:MAG: FtsX-like permease family protein [Bacteroidota bacterium]|nr:FtsX-like permease family protein [Bacteroidota bacterium]
MLEIKLALKNLLGSGLRTWLNVGVLSIAFVVIVFYKGMLDGWNEQARTDTINWETGSGELWHPAFDPYDPLTLQDAHAAIKGKVKDLTEKGVLTPQLVTLATIYPQGRMQNVLLKGINPGQKILSIPSGLLKEEGDFIPAIIGKRMAESSGLKNSDRFLVRWRTKSGTFDALEVKIIGIFSSNVPTVDNGQIWIPLKRLQDMTGMQNEATLFVASKTFSGESIDNWNFKGLKYLLRDLDEAIAGKKGSSAILYGLLLTIALLAIFDTQVLSIFRRRKEIGTYIALGMTRLQVMRLFTIEGSAYSILALLAAAIYGIPFLAYMHFTGIPMPKAAGDMGISVSEKIIPLYSAGMVISTTLLVVISSTIVSFLPTRRISKMKPTDALRGKLQ